MDHWVIVGRLYMYVYSASLGDSHFWFGRETSESKRGSLLFDVPMRKSRRRPPGRTPEPSRQLRMLQNYEVAYFFRRLRRAPNFHKQILMLHQSQNMLHQFRAPYLSLSPLQAEGARQEVGKPLLRTLSWPIIGHHCVSPSDTHISPAISHFLEPPEWQLAYNLHILNIRDSIYFVCILRWILHQNPCLDPDFRLRIAKINSERL